MSIDLEKPLPDLSRDAVHSATVQSYAPAGVPKRKPVPGANDMGNATAMYASIPPATLPWWDWNRFPRRKRLSIVGAAIAAVCLLALIIGLAVGLTKRKGLSNLPLPTSHGGPYQGDMTYYNPGLGSCGITNTDSDLICAVSHVLFDAASTGTNPNENPLCGLKVRLRRGDTSVDIKVVDRCVGCKVDDLDVSPAVFQKLADPDLGRVLIDWSWLDSSPVAYSQS